MTIFDVKRFGAAADAKEDSGPAIRRAIAAAIESGPGAEVAFGEGRYRVAPAEGELCCFLLDGAKGLTIRGAGPKTLLQVTAPDSGVFRFQSCEETFLKDLAIDYDPVPYAQGVIVEKNDAEGWFDLDVQPGFPLPSEPFFGATRRPYGRWGMIYEKDARRLKSGAPDCVFIERWTPVRDRVFRIFSDLSRSTAVKFAEIGDPFVHMARTTGAGVYFKECRNAGIENVAIYSGPSLASCVSGCEDITIRAFAVRFPEGADRLLTMDADGIHCAANRKGPLVEDCFFEGMADDSINIYCPPNVVLEALSPRELIAGGYNPIREGDRLQVMNPRAGAIVGEVHAARVAPCERGWRLTLDAPVEGVQAGADHRDGDTIYNLSASGEGYVIRRNRMRLHRRHGMLLRAGHGLVEDNTIEEVAGNGIVVTNEPDWPEGPFARDIVIRGNTIIAPGYCRGYADSPTGGAIQIKGTKLGHGVSDGYGQREIVLERNRIINPRGTAVFLGGAEDVRLTGNVIEVSGQPARALEAGGLVQANCRRVVVDAS